MEAELRDVHSPIYGQAAIYKVLDGLSSIVTEAAALRDQLQVDNPELRRALNIVEAFLRQKRRLCYGGMAINAHLPSSLKFYNFSQTLPDYDFFTPDADGDIQELLKRLKSAGFDDVVSRLGIHEGTTKIFVNYVGVADITEFPEWMYKILIRRAIVDDGISYVDADFLRMNMYLELSRPLGEVERWEKVYKRLVLLNMAAPPHTRSCSKRRSKRSRVGKVDKHIHDVLVDYICEHQLVFCGADLQRIYANPKTQKVGFILHTRNPVVAFAENPEYHIPILRQVLLKTQPHARLSIVHWNKNSNILLPMYGIRLNGQLVFLLIAEQSCNSYNVAKLPTGKTIRIASLDTAITVWYQLSFAKGVETFVAPSVHCFADSLVEISMKTRDTGYSGVYPLFGISCHGHQPSKASLLKTKKQRVESLKRRLREQRGNRKTKRAKSSSRQVN